MTTTRSTATEPATPEPITANGGAVIPGAQVQHALQGRENQIVELVEATYRLHSAADSVNPPSCFLRFPDHPSSQTIAQPASIGGQVQVDGLKWISSFPENVLASTNIVDDIEHCLKANTSPHLAKQLTGNRDFLNGTLDDVMIGWLTVTMDRSVVFSPFGLGVLDLAVGKYVYDEVVRSGELHVVVDFFHDLRQYG